jgi:hypothetical protein
MSLEFKVEKQMLHRREGGQLADELEAAKTP